MDFDQSLERLLCDVQGMDRSQCIRELTHFGQLRLDFTASHLETLSLDQLRHLLAAAILTVRKRRSA